jgi:hypothetical protein
MRPSCPPGLTACASKTANTGRSERLQPCGQPCRRNRIPLMNGPDGPTILDLPVQSGGSRATAVTSNRHGARLPFESVDEPSADSGAGTQTTAVARSGAPVNRFCAAVQRVAVIAPRTGHKIGRGIWDIPERTRPLTCNVPVGGSAYGQPSARWRAELPRGVSALSAARWDGSPVCESGRAATAS